MHVILIILFSIVFSSYIKVPQQYVKIQDAINHSKSGDVIIISPGKYSPSTNNETFPIRLKSNITITGSGKKKTIIDAEETSRVMFLNSVKNLTVKDLTIRGGYLGFHGVKNHGGGLLLINSNITLENIIITENSGWVGGGISIKNSILNFNKDVSIINNRGLKWGAATAMFGNSKINGDYHINNNKVGIFDPFDNRRNEIALVTKSRGRVNYKKHNAIYQFENLTAGKDLYDKDTIRTGDDGFVIYIYLDDKSLIKVHNNTEIVINKNMSQNISLKSINLNHGIIKVFIDPTYTNDFKIITPTSVASVKGTEFWAMSDKYTQIDQFICETGLVEIKNLFAGTSVLINRMQTAISKMSGLLEIKDNKFIKIPIEKISVLTKVELKDVKEIGKGDKIFLRILKYSSLIGASLIIYSLVSL